MKDEGVRFDLHGLDHFKESKIALDKFDLILRELWCKKGDRISSRQGRKRCALSHLNFMKQIDIVLLGLFSMEWTMCAHNSGQLLKIYAITS